MKTVEYKIDKIVTVLSTANNAGTGWNNTNKDGELLVFCGDIVFQFDRLFLQNKYLEEQFEAGKVDYTIVVWKSKNYKFRNVPKGIVMELKYHSTTNDYVSRTGRGSYSMELNILNEDQFQEWKEKLVERLI